MKFSDLLSEAINNSGMSENTFATAAGINRGDIWRIRNGKTLPKERIFENILGVLKLDPHTEMRIKNAFWSEKIGEKEYKGILDTIGMLNDYSDSFIYKIPDRVTAFGGSADGIPGAIRELLSGPDPEYIASVPLEDESVLGAVLFSADEKAHKTIHIIINVFHQGGVDGSVSDLNKLFGAVRCIRAGVMPVYCQGEDAGVFPYTVCGRNRALLFGNDSFAVVTEPEAAEALFNKMRRICEDCHPLGTLSDNIYEIKAVFAPVQHAIHEAELCGYPYVSNYLDYENLADADRVQPHRKDLVSYAASWYSGVETALKVVSSEGVERFARIGFYKEITPEYVRPFPPEQREKILKRMLTDAAEGRLCVADQHKFAHPEGVDISIAGGCICLELFRYSEEYGYDVYYAHLNLRDSAAAELLKEAISFMPKLSLCLSRDAAVKHISACLGSLSGRFM